MTFCIPAFLLMTCQAPMLGQASESPRPLIHHTSFDDFADGSFGDGGTNLYATRSGSVEVIHRWDLNNDGYLDILIGQDHNTVENEDVLVYWGSATGPQSLLPPMPDMQPLGRLLRQIASRQSAVTRLPSAGAGPLLLVDLNLDGFDDMVFCNFIHNYSVHTEAYIYWNLRGSFVPARRTELPTLLAAAVVADDFNRDGFVDLAFANHGSEGGRRFGFEQHEESYIYWNGPAGFQVENRTTVSTNVAGDIASADLNGDGYSELLFLNEHPNQRDVYIYWGQAEGFSESHRSRWTYGNPLKLTLGDITEDGVPDLIAIHRDGRCTLHRGSSTGIAEEPLLELPAPHAARCILDDFNKDGYRDLVLACRVHDADQSSLIYWGSPSGYLKSCCTRLPTLRAADVVASDFNGDGWTDLFFANERDDTSYDVSSWLYWNGPDGFHAADRKDLQGFGPVSAAAGDLDHDGHVDLVLGNRTSGSAGPIDALLYWGNERHQYSPAACSRLPERAPGGMNWPALADLNQDGWVDIVFGSGRVYRGGELGYSLERSYDLEVQGTHGVSVADLNRDGYLDLLFSAGSGVMGDQSSKGVILWGDKEGFTASHQTALPLQMSFSHYPGIADLNRDGYLELVFCDSDSPMTRIFWGNEGADYHQDRQCVLQIQSASGPEFADLNDDGWLDLILGGAYEQSEFGHPSKEAAIAWGSPDGYSADRVLRLEAYSANEAAVADLNRDGALDLVFTCYHAHHTRSVPALVYWGSTDHGYDARRRLSLPAESSSLLSVADYNQDQWPDLLIGNHQDHGDHASGSTLYWGAGPGFDVSHHQWIPTFGPHFGRRRDVGNIYHRRIEEVYTSSPMEWPMDSRPQRIRWKANTPDRTSVAFQWRTASSRTTLPEMDWSGPDGRGSESIQGPVSLNLSSDARWIQYRVIFRSADGGGTPVLEDVWIDVSP